MQQFNDWNAQARPMAEAGEMLWSEYYKQGYEQARQVDDSVAGKGFAMLQAAVLIDAALAMEAGKMPREEFHGLQRKAAAEMQMHLQQDAMQRQAMFQQWLTTQAFIQQAYRPAPTTQCVSSRVGNSVTTNCR